MEAASLQRLIEATSESLSLPGDRSTEFGFDGPVFRLVLQAVGTLYDLANNEKEPVLDQLAGLAEGTDLEEKLTERLEMLTQLLAPREEIELTERRTFVARSMLPVLDRIQMTIELRLATEEVGDDLKWVPVITGRFGFDEPIQAGTAVTFQLTATGLSSLQKVLKDIEGQFDQVAEEHGNELL
ncbi:MAG: hypothetical protein QOG04_234 [Actinomycetota bacterium]|jgi:hypothetical protein|nr:hypothetical protein [Actinomycetota bacterium]